MSLPPDDCQDFLKGINNDECVFGNGFDHTVFSQVKPLVELEGWSGSSVNWDLIGGDALKQLFDQKNNDDQIKFKFGAIRIPRLEIDNLISRHGTSNLAYEIREENGNRYHGHILFASSMNSKQKTTICGQLANSFTQIHKREQQNA